MDTGVDVRIRVGDQDGTPAPEIKTFSIYRDRTAASHLASTAYLFIEQITGGVRAIPILTFRDASAYATNTAGATTLDAVTVASSSTTTPAMASDIMHVNAIDMRAATTATVTLYSWVVNGVTAIPAALLPLPLNIDTGDKALFVLRDTATETVRLAGFVDTTRVMAARIDGTIESFSVYSGGGTLDDSETIFVLVQQESGADGVSIIPTLDFDEDSLTYTAGTAISSTSTAAGYPRQGKHKQYSKWKYRACLSFSRCKCACGERYYHSNLV